MNSETLARQILRTGVRGKAVEIVLKVADSDLDVSMKIVGIVRERQDEVRSQVLANIWKYWIGEARERLRSGEWKRTNIRSKLRTALCLYAMKKAGNVVARDESRAAFMRSFAKQDEEQTGATEATWVVDCGEERFLRGLVSRVNGELRELSAERAAVLLRLVAVTRRATRGLRRKGGTPWTWARLLREFSQVLEAV